MSFLELIKNLTTPESNSKVNYIPSYRWTYHNKRFFHLPKEKVPRSSITKIERVLSRLNDKFEKSSSEIKINQELYHELGKLHLLINEKTTNYKKKHGKVYLFVCRLFFGDIDKINKKLIKKIEKIRNNFISPQSQSSTSPNNSFETKNNIPNNNDTQSSPNNSNLLDNEDPDPSINTQQKGPTKLRKILMDGENTLWNHFVYQIMRFADPEQDVSLILEKYWVQYKTQQDYSEGDKIVTSAALEILEKSLELKLGDIPANNEKIVKIFLKRLICRSYHGTSSKAAKNILKKGICFDSKEKGHNLEHLLQLIEECHLEPLNFPFTRRDVNKFYVTYEPYNVETYASNKGPEWFNCFKRWGSNQGELDVNQLREKIKEYNPNVKDIEKVVQFVKENWEICDSKKQTAAILIIEQNFKDPNLYHNYEHQGSVLNAYFKHTNFRKEEERPPFIFFEPFNHYHVDCLTKVMRIIPSLQGDNEGLSLETTKRTPKVINALKIPLVS